MSKGKIVFIVSVIVIVVGLSVGTYYAAKASPAKEDTGEYMYIVLGDSIAEGLMGPTPISEMGNYGYYGVLGQRNEFEYYNQAVSGSTSEACLEFLRREKDTGVNLEYSRLREADIIQLSILGNDFLQNRLDDLFFDIASGDMTRINSIVESSTVTFADIIETIKEANPQALLLVQTVYNPYYEGSKIIIPSLIERLSTNLGPEYVEIPRLRGLANELITRLNSIIYDYHEANPDDFVLVDVYTRFNDIYERDNLLGKRLMLIDGVHPSSHGHAEIADYTQEILEEKGFVKSPESAVQKYKELRIGQIKKLYANSTVNVDEAIENILSAKTCGEVTSAYFDAIYEVTPTYTAYLGAKGDKYFKKDTKYMIDIENFSVLPNVPIVSGVLGFLDEEETYIEFDKKGNCTIQLLFKDDIISMLSAILPGLLGGIDREPIDDFIDSYLNSFFPGFHLDHLIESLDLAKAAMGIEFIGLEKDSETLQAFDEALRDGGDFPTEFTLKKFGVKYTGRYFLKDVYSETTGATYNGIFLGENKKNTTPYVGMTLLKHGEELSVYVDLISLNMRAKKVAS